MKLVPFTVDARPYHGYQTIYINPEEVSSVYDSNSTDNPTIIALKNGTCCNVKGSVVEAVDKLQGIP